MDKRQEVSTQHVPEPVARADRGPSLRVALQFSIGLHALLLLVLFRAYVEYSCLPEAPLHIVVRGSADATESTPSFVTSHVAAAAATENSVRPSANLEPLPHQSLSMTTSATVRSTLVQPVRRRGMSLATLRSSVPTLEPAGAGFGDTEDAAPELSSRVTFERTEALPDLPIRVAMRPVDGRRELRPLGLAKMPTVRSVERLREPADAFSHRFVSERTPCPNRPAIERGLEYLSRVQLEDGRWRFEDLAGASGGFPRPSSLRADAAASGLALLAFLGAGHDHFDGRYHGVIQDGIDFLVRIQQHGGEFCDDDTASDGKITSFYAHGIATLALCEAYGMTGDAALRTPAQRALDHLAARLEQELASAPTQANVGDDWSVYGWQLATLRSGQLAGLAVEAGRLARISDRLNELQSDRASADTVSKAVGMAVELYLRRPSETDQLRPAAKELLAHPPELGHPASVTDAATVGDPRRDTYYWYYGSEAMYYLGGDNWQSWSEQLYPRLIQAQVTDGPVSGSWEPSAAALENRRDVDSRLYVTAMNLLTLETEQRQPSRGAAVPIVDRYKK
ncbi:MAG: hypothetical protein AB7G28_25035 [Pirellulales bacterium]